MGEWRGSWHGEQQHLRFHYKDAVVRGAKAWRPPHPPGSGQSSVPKWEKEFCAIVGAIPWKRLCEIQRFMPVYKNVIEWDDSAALEAFHNAKARFRAQYHGFICNIPLPDPDMYIDEVDPDAFVDPDLVADLDKQPPALAEGDTVATDGWDSFITNKYIPPASGWGDAEDPSPTNDNQTEHCSANRFIYMEKPIQPTGWGETVDPHPSGWLIQDDAGNAWKGNVGGWDDWRTGNLIEPTGWGKTVETPAPGWDVKDVSGNWNGYGGGWGEGVVQDNSWGDRRDNCWDNGRSNTRGAWENRHSERGRRNGRKRDGSGRFGSRFTKPRYQIDGYQSNNSWRNGRGRNRTNDPYEKDAYDRQPLAMQR